MRFWLRRFALVFACFALLLSLARAITGRAPDLETLLASILAAVVAASVATWWAWKHGCALKSSR